MKTQFVVTDEEGGISWNEKTETPETFKTFSAAENCAKGLAARAPGQTVRIYVLAAEVTVPTLPVKTTRAG